MQKQQLEIESVEIDRALEELKKIGQDEAVYKTAGPILIKAKREELIKELEDKKELAKTRAMVLAKQEARVKDNLKEVENKINEMIRGAQAGTASSTQPGVGTRPRGE